jgi:hypothetical protein
MINPQKGIDQMDNNSIINRILFAVTIFQQAAIRITLYINHISPHISIGSFSYFKKGLNTDLSKKMSHIPKQKI